MSETSGKTSVTPSPTPTIPGGTNLVQNPSFETASGSTVSNWTMDSTNWVLDTTSAGNNGANSIKLVINSLRTHMFSQLIAITNTVSYTWSTSHLIQLRIDRVLRAAFGFEDIVSVRH